MSVNTEELNDTVIEDMVDVVTTCCIPSTTYYVKYIMKHLMKIGYKTQRRACMVNASICNF